MSDSNPLEAIAEYERSGQAAEFLAKQKAHVEEVAAREAARVAALGPAAYPRVMSSGGYSDGVTVYPSVYSLEFDSMEDAQAAIDKALAEGRYVVPNDGSEMGGSIMKSAGGYVAAIELDNSTRYSASDHTGGR